MFNLIMKNKKIILLIILLVLLIAFFLAIFLKPYSSKNSETAIASEKSDSSVTMIKNDNPEKTSILYKEIEGDFALGNKDAPITIVEYASLSCGHCATFHEKILPDLTKNYIDKGLVRFIQRNFPLNEPALKATQFALCISDSDKKYYDIIKVLFSTQSEWLVKEYVEKLENIAKLKNISSEQFYSCLSNKEIEDKILKQMGFAKNELSISSTPTVFVNGVKYNADLSYKSFAEFVENVRKR